MKEKVAQGRRGEIRVEKIDGKKITTKKALSQEKEGSLRKETDILLYLKKSGITFTPDVLQYGAGRFSYPRIEGEHFIQIYKTLKTKTQAKKLVLHLWERAFQLDCVGVVHGELIRPFKNVLVSIKELENTKKNGKKIGQHKNPVYIIDFERGKMGDYSGKNMRSLSQRLLAEGRLGLEIVKELGGMDRFDIYDQVKKRLSLFEDETNTGITTTIPSGVIEEQIYGDHELSESINVLNGMSLINIMFMPFFLLAVDQITKILFVDNQVNMESPRLTPNFNTGIARGIPIPMGVILSLSGLFLIGIIWYYIDASKEVNNDESGTSYYRFILCEYGVLLLIGGALGNLFDRVLLDGVRDFIDISPALPINWPIFNVADVCIVVGVILIFLYESKSEDFFSCMYGKGDK